MASELRFDNRVVIITGAGSGLGKKYAIEFAKRGAKVLVNDLGAARNGEGRTRNIADRVVKEIVDVGGEATANYESVENGEKIVQDAIRRYGRVDVVVNNAGIIRDRSMVRISEEDWEKVITVHLKGAFMVVRAAWKYMREQKYGRIINTSSMSGLLGNFGQANYATAKMGLYGLSQTLAKEGLNYNILVNTIAPSAASRLTEDIFSPEIFDLMVPSKVVPLVLYLSHEHNTETGAFYEAAGGFISKLRLQRSQGVFFPGQFTAEDLKAKWKEVGKFYGKNDYPKSLTDTLQKVMQFIEISKPKL
jgi:NAD(P)-dependent dehydrogenase (short-subunit alcohol dehydrogenase family)